MASNEQLWTEIHQLRHDCHQLQQERHHLLNESNRLIEENLRLKETISRLVTENQEVRGKCAELREKNNKLLALQQRVAQAEQVSREPNRAPAAPTVGINVIPDEYEEAMVAALNKWWEDEKPERRGLLNLLAQLGVPAEFYTMKAIEAVMQGVSWNGPYSLQPSEKDGGWLFCKSGPLEAIMLPADAVFFDTEPMRKILQRIMIGCENLKGKPQFDEAYSACRLALVGDKQGQYRVTGKGVVCIANHPKPTKYGNPFRSFEELATERKKPDIVGVARTFRRTPNFQKDGERLNDGIHQMSYRDLVAENGELRIELADLRDKHNRLLMAPQRVVPRAPLSAPVTNPANANEVRPPASPGAAQSSVPSEAAHSPSEAAAALAGSAADSDAHPVTVAAVAPPAPSSSNPEPANVEADVIHSLADEAWWTDGRLQQVYRTGPTDSKSDYVERLRAFLPVLSKAVPDIVFRITHLRLTGNGFALHLIEPVADGDMVCECGSRAGSQFFITAESKHEGIVYTLVPPGALFTYDFPYGYRLLLGPVPWGNIGIMSITRPAILKKMLVGGNLYSAPVAMRWDKVE